MGQYCVLHAHINFVSQSTMLYALLTEPFTLVFAEDSYIGNHVGEEGDSDSEVHNIYDNVTIHSH